MGLLAPISEFAAWRAVAPRRLPISRQGGVLIPPLERQLASDIWGVARWKPAQPQSLGLTWSSGLVLL